VEKAGLDAIEAIIPITTRRRRRCVDLAARLGVAVSGGSDYHADQSHGSASIGSVSPREAYERLKELGKRTPRNKVKT
jgi:hypothetical protein